MKDYLNKNKYEVSIGVFLLIAFCSILFSYPGGEELITKKTYHLYFAIHSIVTGIYLIYFRIKDIQLNKIEKILQLIGIISMGLLMILFNLNIYNEDIFPQVGIIWFSLEAGGFYPKGFLGNTLFYIAIISLILNLFCKKSMDKNVN